MPTPSVLQQGVPMHAVPAWSLVPSPRNYNASIIEHEGRFLMAYRSHRMDQGGRCGIVIGEFKTSGRKNMRGAGGDWVVGSNQWLDLPEQIHSVTVHHEDPRLFHFRGRLHVSYTETQFHPSPRPYTCVVKYAALREVKHRKAWRWDVDRVFWPRYGSNDGSHQEKNWQFFQGAKKQLLCIYRADPHTVLELDGERVMQVHADDSSRPHWPWGTIRGGTPPVRRADGKFLTFFHSATPYPVAPHWRRYYAGAYVFEAEPPFRITALSQRPLLTGSEEDGHGFDPRNIDSWKPFVVFPCGIIANNESYLVSYGINDYTIIIAEHSDLALGNPSFSGWGTRYFFTENGGAPVRVFVHEDRPPAFVRWERARGGVAGQCYGVMAVTDPRMYLHLKEGNNAREIDETEYKKVRI